WSALEPGNNISFASSGQKASPLLNALRIDFRELAIVGWLGLVALLTIRRKEAGFLASVNLLIFIGVMPLWIEGRLRQPAVPPLAATAAVAMLVVGEAVWRAKSPHPPTPSPTKSTGRGGEDTRGELNAPVGRGEPAVRPYN